MVKMENSNENYQMKKYENGKPPGALNSVNYGEEEKEKFLPPVKVEPGLDALDRDPELEFRTTDDNAPHDRFRLVFFIMLIHGIGILMPWNMFINAKAYFEDYKLGGNTTETTTLRGNFMFTLGIASQVPNFIMSGINTFCQCGGQASPRRIAISICVLIVMFILTVVMAMIDSSEWPTAFFMITMGTAVVLNMAAGVYQNSTFGIAAVLPMKYTNAIVLGNNLSGVFIAVINLICLAAAPDPRTQAIYYFVAAIVVLLLAFDAYFLLPLSRFYRFYRDSTVSDDAPPEDQACYQSFAETCKRFGTVFKKIWVQAVCVWFVFFVSLTCFPGLWSQVERINFPIGDDFWAPVFCFLSFNLMAFLGNLTSEWIKLPGPRFVWIPILLRGLFIPFFILCNFKPETRIFSVIIANDYVFIIGSAFMAFTSGYYSSLNMMYGPKLVDPEIAGTAGMIMAFCLVTGIVTGVNFSMAVGKIVSPEVN